MSAVHTQLLRQIRPRFEPGFVCKDDESPFICDMLSRALSDLNREECKQIKHFIAKSLECWSNLGVWLLDKGVDVPVKFNWPAQYHPDMLAYRLRYIDHLIKITRNWP